jgi:hypothetical protein
MGDTCAVTRQPEPTEPRHRLAGDRSNLFGPDCGVARLGGRFHRLCQLVVRCQFSGIYRGQPAIGARAWTSPASLDSGSRRQRPGDLRSERLREDRASRHSGMCVSARPGISRFSDVQLHSVVRCGACHRAARKRRPVGIAPEWRWRRLLYCYSETVCTTLPTGRVLATGTFISLTSASSYSGKVCSDVLAFICTTL